VHDPEAGSQIENGDSVMMIRRSGLGFSGRKGAFAVRGSETEGKTEKESDRVHAGIPLTFAHGPGDQDEGKQPLRAYANDAFKRASRQRLSIGLIAAVVTHVAVFEVFPKMEAENLTAAMAALEMIELPPQVVIPPPPEHVARPATPKVAAVEVDEDVTIAPTTFASNPVENLAPPKTNVDLSDRPSFIPYTVAPALRNEEEVLSYLTRAYPSMLKSAGIGGAVVLWLYIDEQGHVQRTVVAESSGFEQLDDAAEMVAAKMRWSPAMNRDKKTAVWLSQAIDFSIA
jgi:TonB family protein